MLSLVVSLSWCHENYRYGVGIKLVNRTKEEEVIDKNGEFSWVLQRAQTSACARFNQPWNPYLI